MATHRVRVTGTVILPVEIEFVANLNDEESFEDQQEAIRDQAFYHVRRENPLVQHADGGVGFSRPSRSYLLGTPVEYTDNLTFDTVEDKGEV